MKTFLPLNFINFQLDFQRNFPINQMNLNHLINVVVVQLIFIILFDNLQVC